MEKATIPWKAIEHLLMEMMTMQQKKALGCGRRIVPALTTDDMLQPNDFPALENHPEFRYEEGLLAGIQATQAALQALMKRSSRDGSL
jgi:hypothetical protein